MDVVEEVPRVCFPKCAHKVAQRQTVGAGGDDDPLRRVDLEILVNPVAAGTSNGRHRSHENRQAGYRNERARTDAG